MSEAADSPPLARAFRPRSLAAIKRARENRVERIDPHLSLEVDENCMQPSQSDGSGQRPRRRRLLQHRQKVNKDTEAPDAEIRSDAKLDSDRKGSVTSALLDVDVLSAQEVALLLRMSVDSVRRIDYSALPHTGRNGAGRNALYLREDVLEYLRNLISAEKEAHSSNMNSEVIENQIDQISDGVRRRPSKGSTL